VAGAEDAFLSVSHGPLARAACLCEARRCRSPGKPVVPVPALHHPRRHIRKRLVFLPSRHSGKNICQASSGILSRGWRTRPRDPAWCILSSARREFRVASTTLP
jgi:hypothetical protein